MGVSFSVKSEECFNCRANPFAGTAVHRLCSNDAELLCVVRGDSIFLPEDFRCAGGKRVGCSKRRERSPDVLVLVSERSPTGWICRLCG